MDLSEFSKKYRVRLNEQQKKAVICTEGPSILLAVPGSGKTTTMISRIGYMVHCCGIDPGKILAITFTKNAAKEMKERYEKTFGAQPVHFQTIHSLCYTILKNAENRGLGKYPEIESSTAKYVTKACWEVWQEYPSEGEVKEATKCLNYIKNSQMTNKGIKLMRCNDREIYDVYRKYNKYLEENGKMDFDDLLVNAYSLLKENAKLLEDVQNTYEYILLDEAQDTSKIQHSIISLIAGRKRNLFMVGDEDQSIYGFRAAYPQALLDFEKNYRIKAMYLEHNYRSTPQIIERANTLIKNNQKRYQKNMLPVKEDGVEIKFEKIIHREDQYRYILNFLKNNTMQTAILYRNNDSAIPFIYYMVENRIPYKCRDIDTNFFTHPAVADARTIWEFVKEPRNGEKFMKAYYKMANIRKEDAQEAVRLLKEKDSSIFESIIRTKRGATVLERRINELIGDINIIRNENAKDALWRIYHRIRQNVSKSDYEKYLILHSIAREDEDLDDFFNKLDKLQDTVKKGSGRKTAKITLSTIHGSKGLEYEQVIIVDAYEGILPAKDNDTEEERRLFYVAITRAIDVLRIAEYAALKQPFVEELKGKEAFKDTVGMTKKPVSRIQITPQSNAILMKDAKFMKIGNSVIHKIDGKGKIISMENGLVGIQFRGGKEKKYSIKVCLEKGLIVKGTNT